MSDRPAIDRKTFVIFSLLVALLISFFKVYDDRDPDYVSPNERSRFYAIHALAERGEFRINEEFQRYGRCLDIAKVGDDHYSDKAPLLALLAAPAYKIFLTVSKKHAEEEGVAYWFIKATTLAPFAVLLFWLICLFMLRRTGDRRFSLFTAFATLFATPAATYFGVLFSHALSATLLLATFLTARRAATAKSPPWLLATGALTGLTFLNEYQTAFALLLMLSLLLFRLRDTRKALWIIAGGLPFAALFFAYNTMLFGTPFSLGYGHLENKAFSEIHHHGLYGITLPSWEAFVALLFSPRIGFILLSPFLLFAFGMLYRRKGEPRPDRLMIEMLAVAAVHFLVIASFGFYGGGWAFGSRHLAAIVPFLAIPAALFVYERKSVLPHLAYLSLTLFSVIIFAVANGLRPLVEETIRNPLVNYYLLALREGYFVHSSALSFLGIGAGVSFLIYATVIIGVFLFLAYRAVPASLRTTVFLPAPIVACFLCTLLMLPYRHHPNDLKMFYWMADSSRHSEEAKIKKHILHQETAETKWMLVRERK